MADENLQKLMRSVKDLVEVIKHKVDTLQMFQSTASDNIRLMKEQQSLMNEKLEILQNDMDEVKETLQSHGGALVNIESKLNGFADAWKIYCRSSQ